MAEAHPPAVAGARPPRRLRLGSVDLANGSESDPDLRPAPAWPGVLRRNHDLRAHRLPNSPNTPPATDSDVEDVSSQPPRPTSIDRFLHGADGHHEGAVRVHRAGTPSSRGAALQCD